MNQTYNERVLALAKEMAKESNPGVYSKREDERFFHIWANTISSFLSAARIAVEHTVDEVRLAMEGSPKSEITTYLKQRCLIPDSGQEEKE